MEHRPYRPVLSTGQALASARNKCRGNGAQGGRGWPVALGRRLPPAIESNQQVGLAPVQGRPGGNGAYRPMLSTGQARMPTLPKPCRSRQLKAISKCRPCGLGVHGQTRRKWSTGLTGQCSLLGRQECLPYLRPVALMAGGCRLPLKAISKCRQAAGQTRRNGAQDLPPCALYWAGRNAYLT